MPAPHANALREVIGTARNIVFFGGAGVSTESGIPDFRSADGLYTARSAYGHRPEDILSITFLEDRPDVFFDYWVHHILHLDAQPNAAHRALAALESRYVVNVVTQNIDDLHERAGSTRVLHQVFRFCHHAVVCL